MESVMNTVQHNYIWWTLNIGQLHYVQEKTIYTYVLIITGVFGQFFYTFNTSENRNEYSIMTLIKFMALL